MRAVAAVPGCWLLAAALLALAAPSGAELLYELPAAGSYELPVIDRVGEYELLDVEGDRSPLLGLEPGQCAVVAFVYLSCVDATGCPLALATLQRFDRALAGREDLAGRVRIVTVSFDPKRDGPAQMGHLRRHMSPRSDWRFLTAANPRELEPVLRDYGQDAVPLVTRDGASMGLMRHVAKVFLVDDGGAVRNVYSSGFLDQRLLLRDVETLLLTDAAAPRP
jgi:cytochrome oxidase Cu insertion factor (SCO1/SenC/PrrC family)